MDNVKIYKGCVIEKVGVNVYVYKDQKIVHTEIIDWGESVVMVLSKIMTMIDEGEI